MAGIGENIASFRKRSGLTQEELSEKMCVTAQAVSKWEVNIIVDNNDFFWFEHCF